MDAVVALVGQLLSALRSTVAPAACPGVWAWATSALGLGIGLLPAVGAFAVALVRRRIGSGYGGGRGLVLAAIGLFTAGVLPLVLFVAAGRVMAAAAGEGAVPGLSTAAARSLRTAACFVGPQSTYLGDGTVAGAFDPSDPVRLGVAVLLLGIVPMITTAFVAAQARLALRRGPAWPARCFWLPTLALVVLTAGVPTGTAEHLWLGACLGAFAGMILMVSVPPPSRETVRRSLEPAARRTPPSDAVPGPGSGSRPGPRPQVQRTPPRDSGPEQTPTRDSARTTGRDPARDPAVRTTAPPPVRPVAPHSRPVPYATFDSGRMPSPGHAPGSAVPHPREAGRAAPLAADPGALPPIPGRGPGPLPGARVTGRPAGPGQADGFPRTAGFGQAGGLGNAAGHGPTAGSGQGAGVGAFAGAGLPPRTPSGGYRAPRFRLIERIGAGGFGRVWLAHDAKLGHTVALKAAHAPDGETEERIRREAAALAAVRHPGCVRIHDLVHASSDPGLAGLEGLVIVMEYVEGVSLGKLVQERGPVDDVAAARIWSGIAGALDAAHRQGVLHRDLKPGNVIVGPSGRPHLIDFGIARRTGDATMTMTGFVLGTPDYLAPEVAAGKKASSRSDVWQLAATVSFALAGYPPRGGHADALSGLRAAASGAKLTHLPRRTAHLHLLKHALRTDPARRPALADTARTLDEWLRRAGVPVDGPVDTAVSPVPPVGLRP